MDGHIRSERLVLRPLTEGDFDTVLALLTEPGVARWWPRYDAAKARKDLFTPSSGVTVWGIEHEGQIIGALMTTEEAEEDYRSAAIDIFIGKNWWGKGFGTEAINAACGFLVGELGHHRITIDPAVANTRAIRSYERAGFRKVGVMHKYERGADGTWHDSVLMERIESRS